MKALAAAAQKNRHAEFKFELFDAAGQAWLRDVAALGGTPEVAFFRDGDEVAKLPDKHATHSRRSVGRRLTAS
jgi:hypothetical protein